MWAEVIVGENRTICWKYKDVNRIRKRKSLKSEWRGMIGSFCLRRKRKKRMGERGPKELTLLFRDANDVKSSLKSICKLDLIAKSQLKESSSTSRRIREVCSGGRIRSRSLFLCFNSNSSEFEIRVNKRKFNAYKKVHRIDFRKNGK